MPVSTLFAASLLIAGFATGAIVVAFWMLGRVADSEARRRMAEAQLSTAESVVGKISETFQSLADAALRSNQQSFLEAARGTLETVRVEMTADLTQRQSSMDGLVRPLTESLGRLEIEIHDLELARQHAMGSLEQQLQTLAQSEMLLQKETAALVTALRAPQVRGRWGEITLRRVAELAGMVEHCDFFEQKTHDADDGNRIRPDMTVQLPGGRIIVVDAKVPLSAFLDAVAASDDTARRAAMVRHSQQMAKHIEQLSGKAYWGQFQPAPEFVVLFLPGEHLFSAALEHKPTLFEDAARRKIVVATPSTLIAVLKGVAYGWRQEQLAQNAEEIRKLAAELFERVVNVQAHFSEIGGSLGKAVEAFNRCVASLETRLFPSLRKIRDLGATTAAEPEAPEPIETAPRELTLFES